MQKVITETNEYISKDPVGIGIFDDNLPDAEKIDINLEKSAEPDWGDVSCYDWIDLNLQKASLFSNKSKVPIGTKTIGRKLELSLYSSLLNSVKEYLSSLSGNERELPVLDGVRQIINQWYDINVPLMKTAFEELFRRGFGAGIVVGGGRLDEGDKLVMKLLEDSNFRIGSRIRLFADESIEKFEEVIHFAFGPNQEFNLDKLIQDMNQEVPARRFALERIARTEVGQTSGTGRFYGWYQKPEEIYYYKYWYHGVPDARQRYTHKLRIENSPYSWSEAWYLFTHNHMLNPSNGKWEMGAINERCTISREPVDEEFRGNRFIGRDGEFQATFDVIMPWDEE